MKSQFVTQAEMHLVSARVSEISVQMASVGLLPKEVTTGRGGDSCDRFSLEF